MYKPDVQAAIKRKHWYGLVGLRPSTAVNDATRSKWHREFERFCHVLGEVCSLNGLGDGTEACALLGLVGDCLRDWRSITPGVVGRIRARYRRLMDDVRAGRV